MEGQMAQKIREQLVLVLRNTQSYSDLLERAKWTEVGFSGYVSQIDTRIAKQKNLKPLNRFEKWLLAPYISLEKEKRQKYWEEAIKNL